MTKSEIPGFLKRYEKRLKVSYHDTKFFKNQKVITFDSSTCNKPLLGRNNKTRRRQPLVEHKFEEFELYDKNKPNGFYYKIDEVYFS